MLFIPHISANTQARHEGYFRLEWELAAERAMSIASGVAFILPIIIDATREPDALVPDRFRKVQWTRLPGGEVTPEVLQRFVKRWAHRAGVGMVEPDMARVSRPVSPNDTGQETRATPKVGRVLRARRLWATAVLLAVLGAGGTFGDRVSLDRRATTIRAVLGPAEPIEPESRVFVARFENLRGEPAPELTGR